MPEFSQLAEVVHPTKLRVLATIAIVAQLGVITGAAAAWIVEPANTGIVTTALAFMQSVVTGIVGFFTGSAQPDRTPEVP